MNDLKYQFRTANIVIKLILINIAVFLCFLIFPFIFRIDPGYAMHWFSLPASLSELILQPWSLLTYAFLHGGFWHIFGNMFILYWFGNIVLNLFSEKRFLTIYLLGAIAGGAFFVLAYNIFPVFREVRGVATLIGASAAVRAIMIFIAAYSPNTEVRVIFFNVKLWHIAVFVLLTDLLQIPSANSGGMLAHLGGAIFGFIYARQMAKGNDIGAGWDRMVEGISSYFNHKKKKSAPMKTVYRNTATAHRATGEKSLSKIEQQRQIDEILDKISKSGYDSLSKAEKDFLFKAGKDS